jgi:hypothetical protein
MTSTPSAFLIARQKVAMNTLLYILPLDISAFSRLLTTIPLRRTTSLLPIVDVVHDWTGHDVISTRI